MNTHVTSEQLSLFIDRRLAAADQQSIERHLETCDECSRELASLEGVKVRIAAMPVRYAPPKLVSALKRKYISGREVSPRWVSPRFLWKPLAILALLGGVWFGIHARQTEDYIDMDALLTAHNKYEAESLAPQADFAQADYSARLASFYRDEE